MNIVICDDDTDYVNKIIQLLNKYQKIENLNIYTYLSGEEFLKQIDKEVKADIIFLDIEMSEASGIEVARYLREKGSNAIFIFISGHLNYVSETFRLGAFQFLVKPIDEKAFNEDFERAITTYKNNHQIYQIRWRGISNLIEYSDIYYIEAYNRHLYVHTESMKYECVGIMPEEEKKLKPYGFVRCHQGFLVNLYKIIEISKTNLILSNETIIPIGRRYREELLEIFNLFLAGRLI